MVRTERIPLRVDIRRIIEVLATQIYQSPLALLRENTQNAFDAILMRMHRGDKFDPKIVVDINTTEIRVSDNGIGMTYTEVQNNFWQAGASSKNTPEARAAGVVGTFGIGAMANFGIASGLEVVTESAVDGERTETRAERDTLSVSNNCIEIISQLPQGNPGTLLTATISSPSAINVPEATNYITEFVRYISVPVTVNGALVSQNGLDDLWPEPTPIWSCVESIDLAGRLSASIRVLMGGNGQIWIGLTDIHDSGKATDGRIVLSQGAGHIQAFRSGFGLATVGVASTYAFGGGIDLPMLQPTAGREALSTSSMNLLQEIILVVERWVSERLGDQPVSDRNLGFIEWCRRNRRPDLCSHLRIRLAPSNDRIPLADVREQSASRPVAFYGGTDQHVIQAVASEDRPLLVSSQRNPRRACERAYLDSYCAIEVVSEGPSLVEAYSAGTREIDELAIAHQVADTLERDYFLRVKVFLGRISHRVPALLIEERPVVSLALDPNGSSFFVLKELYSTEYRAFGSFIKDFVRTVVFPQVKKLVPSSTREGAAAFLKRIRSKRDLFEYQLSDRQELSSIWEDYYRGSISFEEAAKRSRTVAQRSIQVVSRSERVSEVVPDLVLNQEHLPVPTVGQYLPAISRPDVVTRASILTIDENNPALNEFRCFLSLSDRVTREKGEFFLQPHKTSVVWGGAKVLFVFQHHSGEFGLYYDILSDQLVSPVSGGGEFSTSTLLLGSRVFIPVPNPINRSFVPKAGETKRLEVRSEILHLR